jgi:NADH dehydrogenase
MARAGWRVRVAVRQPDLALWVRTYGVVGQVEPVFANIRDDASVRAVTHGAGAVVNCVGILAETRRQGFAAVQHEGAARVVRIAAEEGVARMVQISAIGADEAARSGYASSKARGERAVLDAFPSAAILRPSIVFGAEDQFFNRFAQMARSTPVLPVVGADTLFQPVHVDDVAHAAELCATGRAPGGIYELGGPDVRTFRALMQQMLQVVERRRAIVNVPFWMAGLMGWGFDLGNRASFGLVSGPLTRDQVRNLRRDNVVGSGVRTFADLGIQPTSIEAVLPEYLWRFRDSGQYAAIKESARNMRP